MSQFDFPRIHVQGQFYFNPGTANNDSIDPTDEGVVTAITETVQPVDNGLTDEAFKTWLASMDPEKKILNGQWNVYGDMNMSFENVTVGAIQLNPETIIQDPARYPLIGSTVAINKAFALDLDPEGFSTTQVFCDSFSFKGTTEAVGPRNNWFTRKPSRGATRWINWYRNLSYHGLPGSSGAAGGVSAMWQMSFPVPDEDLSQIGKDLNLHYLDGNIRQIYDQFPRVNADGQKLKGFTFRMDVYLCYPLIADQDLYDNYFSKGIPQENPAIGKLVGTFAPWYETELASFTLGRYLNSNLSFTHPYSTHPAYLGPVLARVNKKLNVISLDLVNTFPEDGAQGVKFNMGTASLQVQLPNGEHLTIGEFAYDQEAYERTGGLVDIPFNPALIQTIEDGLLAITLGNFTQGPLLLETPFMVASDQSCQYLNEGTSENRQITVNAVFKGKPLTKPVDIIVEQWKLTPTSLLPNMPVRLNSVALQIPTAGFLNFNLDTLDGPGVRVFRFVTPGFTPGKLNIITDYMISGRVLPETDYGWVTDEDLTFDLIYKEIFRYYYLIFPGMNKRLQMNDPTIWNTPTAAEYVLKRSSVDRWEDYEYMPRTRDLSDSRRNLLHRYCHKIIGNTISATE